MSSPKTPVIVFTPRHVTLSLTKASPFANVAEQFFPPSTPTTTTKRSTTTSSVSSTLFLTPGIVQKGQRRRSDQDCQQKTPASARPIGNASRRVVANIRPLRASPLFSESPGQFSASKTCQALIHSPCRSENFRRQRRRLYHQDEYDEVKRKLSLPDSAPFRTPKLGKGGFGSVYIGKYGGKQVAIKQLHNNTKAGQSGESLCAEMNAFRLRHPNIVKILTFSCSGPFVQLVFEYVGRRNLQQILDESVANSFERLKRVQFCQQTADALNFCHSNRVLHLDVKPANILITDDWRCCKLADFGCSRSIALPTTNQADGGERRENNSTNTAGARPLSVSWSSAASASIPGTLIYKAPELLRGAAPSPSADVYSFGYVLWQCATRQIPFDGMNPHTIVFCVVARNLRPSVNKDGGVKFDDEELLLIDLAEKCWPASPDDRINLTQVQELLQEFYAANVV